MMASVHPRPVSQAGEDLISLGSLVVPVLKGQFIQKYKNKEISYLVPCGFEPNGYLCFCKLRLLDICT